MGRKLGWMIIAAGTALILAAMFFLWHNRQEDDRARAASESLVERIEASMGAEEAAGEQAAEEDGMTVVMLDGYAYIGCVEIPAIDRRLPVMADWSYQQLQLSPCRQFGSVEGNDLVIAAHNYDSHFGRLKELIEGAEVLFTDMEGNVTGYTVARVAVLQPDEVDAVRESGHDLVLYTCTKGGKTRVAVFCDRAEGGGAGEAAASLP